jgi:GTP pyrophosphokinase
MIRTQKQLLDKVLAYNPKADIALIEKACEFAKKAHEAQKRASGEAYFMHPLAVADILAELKLDSATIITALLHDTVEDTNTTLEIIKEQFGEQVAQLVDGVTKLNKIEFQPENIRQAENFRKLLLAMSQDIRILLVKIADRLHNMRTLHHIKSTKKRLRISNETLEIYALLTERIGMHKIRDELQDLAFAEIHSEVRASILNRIEFLGDEAGGKKIIDSIIKEIKSHLTKSKVKAQIYGRQKRPYSIWDKMKRKNVNFEQLSDVMAFRIVVKDVATCYKVLGIIHASYHMIPGSFKDYISTPKTNDYQSLHTTIIGPEKKKVEIQIRTEDMHETAELGIAAHWSYKQNLDYNIDDRKYKWMRELLNILEHTSGPEEFLRNTKFEMYQDQVFCFSPRGDLTALPKGATPIDFAYAIHSDIGNSCMGVKINGVISPLRSKLTNGDQVEVICSNSQHPSPEWEKFVITGKAKSEIRKYVRSKQMEEYRTLGEAILSKYFVSENMEFKESLLKDVLKAFSKESVEDLYVAVGEGLVPRHQVLKAAYPDYDEHAIVKKKRRSILDVLLPMRQREGTSVQDTIPITGLIPGMAVHFADCCHPLPGDSIVGVINSGKGVTIHIANCENLQDWETAKERMVNISWDDTKNSKHNFVGRLKLLLSNKHGALASITHVISGESANIHNLKIVNRSSEYFEIILDIEVINVKHFRAIKAALRASKLVFSVQRLE